jgi:tRNA-binding EMAP/Myf-like protein
MTHLLLALLLLLATSQAFTTNTRLAHSAQSRHTKSAQRLYCTPEPTPASATAPAPAAAAKKAEGVELLEIRVGRIVSLAKHPEADNLYVEQVLSFSDLNLV